MRLLTLLLAGVLGFSVAVKSRPSPWLGNKVDPVKSAFCVKNGCKLVRVRDNRAFPFDWKDGQMRRYSLPGGKAGYVLDVDVRPGGWVSGVRLTEASRGGTQNTALVPFPSGMAAKLLTAATGRLFTAQAVQNCSDGKEVRVLSQWETPGGLPFRAVCGPLTGGRGVAVGWGRQNW